MRLLLLSILSFTLSAAFGQSKQVSNMNTVFLEQLMQTKPDQFGEALKHYKDWIIQIKYTQIDRDRSLPTILSTFNQTTIFIRPAL
jgi:hypothetical protein